MPKLTVNTEISPDGIYRYEIKARREGSKKKSGLRIVVPAQIARGLRHLGWGGKWLHIRVNGETSFIASTRPHPMSVTVALPLWCRGDIQAGDTVELEVRDPSDWRCVAENQIVGCGVDWAALPPREVFMTGEGETLKLHNRYREPFTMKRTTPFKETMWLMGIYQAEGSKTETANDWTFANKSAPLLARGIGCLEVMGIDKSRLYLEVLYGKHQTAEFARSVYEPLGVEITTVRVRTGKVGGNEAGILHIRNSKSFLRMTRELLERMVADNGMLESMPRSAVREFALGFLDGDGTITILPNAIELRLSGSEYEQLAVCRALIHGFGWSEKGTEFISESYGIRRTMSSSEGVELLLAGGFRFSLSRARLLGAMDSRMENLMALYDAFGNELFWPEDARKHVHQGVINLLRRWGSIIGAPRLHLTDRAIATCMGWRRLAPEFSVLNERDWRAKLGVKGMPYPLTQSDVVAE